MENCIFCKIISKEIPSSIVHEDETSFSFLDINPVNKGHLLVIPKDHFETIITTPDQLVAKLFLQAKKLMPAIQSATKADFVAVTVVGTDVPHFHIHLIPRFFSDGLSEFWPTKTYENPTEKDLMAIEIQKYI